MHNQSFQIKSLNFHIQQYAVVYQINQQFIYKFAHIASSSSEQNQSYKDMNFEESALMRDEKEYCDLFSQNGSMKSQNLETQNAPTYNEIISCIQSIQQRYPHQPVQNIISGLYDYFQLAPKESLNTVSDDVLEAEQDKEIFILQCKYAAKAYVELGFGISRMRRQIMADKVDLQIESKDYDRIINTVFYSAYKRLEQFIKQNLIEDQWKKLRIIKFTNKMELNCLISMMRFARKYFGNENLHTFLKLLKVYYDDYQVSFSKTHACNLYETIYHFIEMEKRKGRFRIQQRSIKPDQSGDEEYQQELQLRQQQPWTEQMTNSLIEFYIQQPASINFICSSLKCKFNASDQLIKPKNVKYHLTKIFKSAISKVQEQMDRIQCLELGNRFKRLVKIDDQRIKQIITSSQPMAINLRKTLCQYYRIAQFDIKMLEVTILSINEFINMKEHQKITLSLRTTKLQNSICRDQYEFAGKRRKVLLFKKKKKYRDRPFA